MRNVVVATGILIILLGIVLVVTNAGLEGLENRSGNGVFDYAEATGLEDELLVLDGYWRLFPGEFIDPHDIPQTGGVSIQVPGTWNGVMNGSGYGIGTYVLTLEHLPEGHYGLLLDTIYTAGSTFVNGHLVGSSGMVGEDKDSYTPQFLDVVTTFGHRGGDPLTIVIHVANFYHPRGGIGVAPIFGPAQQLVRFHMLISGFVIVLVSFFISSALFILLFHGKMNRDNGLLLFALFCVTIAVKIATSNSLLTWIFPDFPIHIISKLEHGTIPLAAMCFMAYSTRMFTIKFPKWIKTIFWVVSTGYTLAVLVLPVSCYHQAVSFYIMLIILCFLYWVYLLTKESAQESYSLLLVFGSLVMLATMALQLYYWEQGRPNVFLHNIMGLGMVLFIIVNHHLFSYRFIQAQHEVKELTNDLEAKVNERTKRLNDLNEQLSWSASHDELTRLFNRNELIRTFMKGAVQGPFSVAYMDLDNFKMINDRFSHEAGDEVLRSFAEHLSRTSRSTDLVHRVGGDEFVLLMPHTDREGAESFAKRLLEGMGGNASFNDGRGLTTSIGLAVADEGTDDLDELVKLADKALLQSKRDGKNRYTTLIW
jgi:diguanylate cyclase (GGDEF)-like protein